MFFAVNLPAQGQTWSNPVPARIRRKLRGLSPKDDKYEIPFVDPIVLVDNSDGSTVRGRILYHLHHVDPPFPPPGTDCFDTDLRMDINIPAFGMSTQSFASGPTTVERRTIKVRAVGPSSKGRVASQQSDRTDPADSFFDVFVVVGRDAGRFHTEDSTHMTTTINSVPPEPGEIYLGPGTVIPLYADDGTQVGEILGVSHEIHGRIECPKECLSLLSVAQAPDIPNSSAPGGPTIISVGIPLGGAGLEHDIVKGLLTDAGSGIAPPVGCLADDTAVAVSERSRTGRRSRCRARRGLHAPDLEAVSVTRPPLPQKQGWPVFFASTEAACRQGGVVPSACGIVWTFRCEGRFDR